MSSQWIEDAIFYHIYPLGLCEAPQRNDFNAPVQHRLEALTPWMDHIQSLGANALYLGPLFQSSSHGYDTVDYYQVDRRLGDNHTLSRFTDDLHRRGMHLVLDAVFNHVGRDFWAFKDVQEHGEKSAYQEWFQNLRFGEYNAQGDPFQYEGWQGHTSLVKLNLSNPHVRDHLFGAVKLWFDMFNIDGLRLDAADCIEFDFLSALSDFSQTLRPNFWLMGEVVHGDYSRWVNPETLDSVTNYEAYKGLYSSLRDSNYFEIAHTLGRQFGKKGRYQGLRLYNFVDNHDVDRVASKLTNPNHLYPLYTLLFTMPGIPSLYYGSEWGIEGVKEGWSDASLRPTLDLNHMRVSAPVPHLTNYIQRLAKIRVESIPLRVGQYRELFVDHQQFVFLREGDKEKVVVALNSASEPKIIEFAISGRDSTLVDLLEPQQSFQTYNGQLKLEIPPTGGRILTQSQ